MPAAMAAATAAAKVSHSSSIFLRGALHRQLLHALAAVDGVVSAFRVLLSTGLASRELSFWPRLAFAVHDEVGFLVVERDQPRDLDVFRKGRFVRPCEVFDGLVADF